MTRVFNKSRLKPAQLFLFTSLLGMFLFAATYVKSQTTTALADTAYVSKTYGIPLRNGYLLYDGGSDENAAAWSKFLTMNVIVSTDDPIKERTWGALQGFFYWYYDDNARQQFIRTFAPPEQVDAFLEVYGPRDKFYHFFNRLSDFKRVEVIEQLFVQIKSHPDLRPVTGALRVAYADRMQTTGYDFSSGMLGLDDWSLRLSIGIRGSMLPGIGLRKFENARSNRGLSNTGIPMSRAEAEALINRLQLAAGAEPSPFLPSSAPLYAGLFVTIAPDRRTGILDRLDLFEDAQLTRPIPEIDGAVLWTDTGAQREAARLAEEARKAAQAAEQKRQDDARLAAERKEQARLAAERKAIQNRVAAERDSKALAVLGIRLGMTEAEARAALSAANADFSKHFSRTGFERQFASSNVGDKVEIAACERGYESIQRPFLEYRHTIVGNDLADSWFLPTLGAENDARLLAKSIELAVALPPECAFRFTLPGASFETHASYKDETVWDGVRVYIGQSGPQKGRVTAVLRSLIHHDVEMDVYERSDTAYGTPNFQGRRIKYWLADPKAPVAAPDQKAIENFMNIRRPDELVPCIGSRAPDQPGTADLMGGTNARTTRPYGTPTLVTSSVDLRNSVSQSCGAVLGIRADQDHRTLILLLDTDYVVTVRQERDAAAAASAEAEPEIKF